MVPPERQSDPSSADGNEPKALQFVSRGGLKLLAAIQTFNLQPSNKTVADFGCNVGGFTHCWLENGANRVFAVDTAYGVLAWKLRRDPRVVVMERTNALHLVPPEKVSYVSIDAGWTRQALIIPAAVKWLIDAPDAAIITLIKPHYESANARRQKGVLTREQAKSVCRDVIGSMPSLGVRCRGVMESPIEGQKGNTEYLAWLTVGT
jgi:23S rRNA (cytidine1920-2'-O)/16S rRNA (cytidine1409-2'-O)-methyltransferase